MGKKTEIMIMMEHLWKPYDYYEDFSSAFYTPW